jgi:hypothetical protein
MPKFNRINVRNYAIGVALLGSTVALLGIGQPVAAFVVGVAAIVMFWEELRKIV